MASDKEQLAEAKRLIRALLGTPSHTKKCPEGKCHACEAQAFVGAYSRARVEEESTNG